MSYIKYIFNYKNVMKTIDDLEHEVLVTQQERDTEIDKRKLLEKENKDFANKIVVALEEINDLKNELKKFNKKNKKTE